MAKNRSLLLTAAVGLIVLGTPALAIGLTESDFAYLATQSVPRDSLVLAGLSPKEQGRLHAIIVDQKTANDPAARAKDVADAITEYHGHQLWEQAHPGELWDVPKR